MDEDPTEEQDHMADADRCTATASSTGERCKQPAIPGGNVCRFHGGAAPQVEQKAREVAKAHQRSPKDTFEQQSKQSQQQDVARRAERVTDRTLLYNLNPNQYDFENFDTPSGDAKSVFDL